MVVPPELSWAAGTGEANATAAGATKTAGSVRERQPVAVTATHRCGAASDVREIHRDRLVQSRATHVPVHINRAVVVDHVDVNIGEAGHIGGIHTQFQCTAIERYLADGHRRAQSARCGDTQGARINTRVGDEIIVRLDLKLQVI